MASSIYDDDSSDSNFTQEFDPYMTEESSDESKTENLGRSENQGNFNVIHKIINRQMYGRFTKNTKSKTERIFNEIHCHCRFQLDHLIVKPNLLSHIFMGFTLCGQFFISYKEKYIEEDFIPTNEYVLYIWRFLPGKTLQYISKHRIFKLFKGSEELEHITFMQFPTDPYKILCYGLGRLTNPVMAFISILTLPIANNCRYCKPHLPNISDDTITYGWCIKHGFMLHFMFSMIQPAPKFDPNISLSYPDHLVFNTGHYIHILKVSNFEPVPPYAAFSHLVVKDEDKTQTACSFNDNISEISETASDNLSTNSIVEAILEDFSEYDLEGSDCNKPFHELNISCEPLNVTGKSYHNALVQNIVDPRLKRLQASKDCLFSVPQTSTMQKSLEKSKIDKKIAEKTYEFTEENEKCEKLSSFRKKRLAEKKYEFSDDNLENIVPFNSLRKERRYLYRSQRCIRSPEFTSTLFLSPRSTGIRSPMQSPNSRNGQFSPGGGRNLYCPGIRNSPHYSKSPISPKDSARKINVYSPSLDSDCSDYDSKLILRQVNNFTTSHHNDHKVPHHVGLLIVDSKRDETTKWIKKVVRRYSSTDFETSSLVSGQSKDEYNIPIEIPLLVQTLTDQQLDVVTEFRTDQVLETQLIVTQRTLDCEQFVQRRAQKLCSDNNLEFLHCEDYDIKLLYICPLNGHIVCQAVIKIVGLQLSDPQPKPEVYMSICIFTWDIDTDAFQVIEPPDNYKLQLFHSYVDIEVKVPTRNHKRAVVMNFNCHSSKTSLRDYNNYYEIFMKNKDYYRHWQIHGYPAASDSE